MKEFGKRLSHIYNQKEPTKNDLETFLDGMQIAHFRTCTQQIMNK